MDKFTPIIAVLVVVFLGLVVYKATQDSDPTKPQPAPARVPEQAPRTGQPLESSPATDWDTWIDPNELQIGSTYTITGDRIPIMPGPKSQGGMEAIAQMRYMPSGGSLHILGREEGWYVVESSIGAGYVNPVAIFGKEIALQGGGS